MNWYIIRVAKGQDNRVKNAIREQLVRYKVETAVSDIVIPTEKEIKLKNGKKIVRSKNMLAGYVFLLADLTDQKVVDIINDTPGSYGFMGSDKKVPLALKQHEVDKMLGNIVDEEEVKIEWIKGQPIRITDGPFKNFEGVVNDVDDIKKKLKVEVKIFGRPTPLELDYHSAEKIEGAN
jgi:transcription termination/antitermination protein NusG